MATTDVEEACKDVDIAVMVGGFPRKQGMERKDVMSKNVSIYKSQASALEKFGAKGLKVPLSFLSSHPQLLISTQKSFRSSCWKPLIHSEHFVYVIKPNAEC